MQNILKEIIFWALLASCDFHNNEVQCPRKALLADAWSEILAGLSELGLTVITHDVKTYWCCMLRALLKNY